ncbi:MAG TPA: VTT domain-containing protein [Pyrinomonadaceae bacterium]|jgi:membrane protein YqaA with SNARE-associated domain
MFRAALNWLNQSFGAVVHWLEQFVISVPLYVAAPSMVIIGALDSSLLSLPEINDYLVVMRCTKDPTAALYFPLFAAAGSVIGCLVLYTLLRRGGQAVLRRRFRADHILRVERAYARFGFLAVAVPAMLPPPMPFKIFVATAGTLEYPRWRFMLTVMIARSLRYYIEGVLAVFYGEQVLSFMKQHGFTILAIVIGLCLLGLAVYLILNRYRRADTLDASAEREVEAQVVEPVMTEGRETAVATESKGPSGR